MASILGHPIDDGVACAPRGTAPLARSATAPSAREMIWSTAFLTLHGQFLGSGQRFEYEFMTMKSSGRAVVPAPLERHHNSRAARRLRMARQPKNRGPKSLNQYAARPKPDGACIGEMRPGSYAPHGGWADGPNMRMPSIQNPVSPCAPRIRPSSIRNPVS